MKTRILERKLSFLHRVMGARACQLSSRIKCSFCDDISSLCLVKECRFSEEYVGTRFTEDILNGGAMGPRQRKEEIESFDKQLLFDKCMVKSHFVAEVSKRVGWARLWDACLSLGVEHTAGLQQLSLAMAHPGRGSHPCPLCDALNLQQDSVLDHIMRPHGDRLNLQQGFTTEDLMAKLESLNLSFLPKFRKLFHVHVY